MLVETYSDFWTSPLAFTLTLFGAAVLYSVEWYRLSRLLPNAVSGWRFAAFMCGVLSVGIVCATPLAHLDHQSLTAHMVQHLVLMTLAAPLILLGEPLLTLRQSFSCSDLLVFRLGSSVSPQQLSGLSLNQHCAGSPAPPVSFCGIFPECLNWVSALNGGTNSRR
jgi:hypothetical protein